MDDTVVGRKNHYGSKSRRGTEIAAVFYTLLQTAKLGVDPASYLSEAALADIQGQILLPREIRRASRA
jgi:transposase